MTTLARTNGFPQPTDGLNGNLTITGRTLTHYTVTLANVGVAPYAPNSNFELLIRAIEQVGSIELIGTPTTNAFRVAISGAAPSDTTGSYSLQGYCNTSVNGSGVSGTTVALFTY